MLRQGMSLQSEFFLEGGFTPLETVPVIPNLHQFCTNFGMGYVNVCVYSSLVRLFLIGCSFFFNSFVFSIVMQVNYYKFIVYSLGVRKNKSQIYSQFSFICQQDRTKTV